MYYLAPVSDSLAAKPSRGTEHGIQHQTDSCRRHTRSIDRFDFDSDLLILSGRVPVLDVELEISSDGVIVKAINTSVSDDDETDKKSGLIQDSDNEIFVNDIINPGAGDVVFRAASLIGGGDGTPASAGDGTWEFRDSLPQVRIVNASDSDLLINNISVLSAL